MTWGERATKIYKVLETNQLEYLVTEMENEYGMGGTGGEQFSIICTWLAKMSNRNPEVYSLIKEDAEIILQKGIDIKYFTKEDYRRL
jgi:hypothetical protein